MNLGNLQPTDYTVAWICLGDQDHLAAKSMLDTFHQEIQLAEDEDNTYTLGSIAGHNVVILYIRDNGPPFVATPVATTRLKFAFRAIQHWLLVGIAQGVPSKSYDVRIGDVVVGEARGGLSAVTFLDLTVSRNLEHPPPTRLTVTATRIAKPSRTLADAVVRLRTLLSRAERDISVHLLQTLQDRSLPATFKSMDPSLCPLYGKGIQHIPSGRACAQCGHIGISNRPSRSLGRVHYGCVGTTSVRIRNPVFRDALFNDHGIVCLDRASAGFVSCFPGVVIMGIRGYADSHSSAYFDSFAAAIATTYARELVKTIPLPSHVNGMKVPVHLRVH